MNVFSMAALVAIVLPPPPYQQYHMFFAFLSLSLYIFLIENVLVNISMSCSENPV